ncbi:MAG: hypothetical protein JXR69_03095 [Candidatus Delongbacteria bacterium]|nr:hypothetical protein [Candidatus Delongbacteria bacterium]
MLLKPYSTSWKITYLEFLMQSYFLKLPEMGPKKVNIKGINKINEANLKGYKSIEEDQLINRNFEAMKFSKTLINSESEHAKRLLQNRTTEEDDDNEIVIQKYNMNDYGAIFTIELFDILWLYEVKNGDLTEDLDIIKDTMTFGEHNKELTTFEEALEFFGNYLENPAKKELLEKAIEGLNKSLEGYKENPFAYFCLGLIYHRPTDNYDLVKAEECFLNAEKHAVDNENKIFAAYIEFMLGWIYYIRGDIDKAIKVTLKSLSKDEIILSETYYNLAKYYAIKKDAVNSIKYLDIIVMNADNFYTLKADIDDDFASIRDELEKYFVHLRDDARKAVDNALNEYGISLKVNIDVNDNDISEQSNDEGIE